MAKGFKSFLPQLSIAVPVIATGMLIFTKVPDPITSLLAKTEEEKQEEMKLMKTSKGDKEKEGSGEEGEGKGKDGQTGAGQGGKELDAAGAGGSGVPDKDGKPKGTEGGGDSAGKNVEKGSQNQDGGSQLGGPESKGVVNGDVSDTAESLVGAEANSLGDSAQGGDRAGNPDGQEEGQEGPEEVSLISSLGADGAERKEVSGKSSGRGAISWGAAFFDGITSEDIE